MATNEKALYEKRGGAAWITLNSPENRNALSAELLRDLGQHLETAIDDSTIRCVVLTGNGPSFCAGADLKAGRGIVGTSGRSPFVTILDRIVNGPKPVIAAINGPAYAGGLGLVAASDIAIAADSATFSFSEVRIGVIPAVISVVCLPKLGPHHGMRLFLTGERFDAAQAVAYGLLHRAVPAAELRAAVESEVEAICRGGPQAVAETKKLVRTVLAQPMAEAFAWTEKKSAEMFASAEAAEGMAAFREKRKPKWVAG